MGGCVGGWVGQWVGSGQITKIWVGDWVGQWLGSCQITKYQINLDLIEIIQFRLKIYDLVTHPHLWVGIWAHGYMVHSFDILTSYLNHLSPLQGYFWFRYFNDLHVVGNLGFL